MTPRTFVWDSGMITWVEAYNLSLICIAVYNQVQTRGPIFNAVHSQIEIEKTLFQVSAYKCNCSIVSKLQDTNILVHWTTSGQPIEVSNSVFAFGKSFLIYINDSHFLKIYFKSWCQVSFNQWAYIRRDWNWPMWPALEYEDFPSILNLAFILDFTSPEIKLRTKWNKELSKL